MRVNASASTASESVEEKGCAGGRVEVLLDEEKLNVSNMQVVLL